MNFSRLFLTASTSFIALAGSPAFAEEELPLTEILEDDLFDDDLFDLDDDILVLEEELKQDAGAIEQEPVAIDPPTLEAIPTPQLVEITQPVLEEPALPTPTAEVIVEFAEEPALPQETAAFEAPALLQVDTEELAPETPIQVDLEAAFAGSPIIYSILLALSTFALCLWLYSLFTLRQEQQISAAMLKNLRNKLSSNHFDDALSLCLHHDNLFSKMVASGIQTRRYGPSIILETMSSEGKRASSHFWQRLSLLNDIAVVAPMLGLLGTVLGMFYAFYDLNRSIESISSLFDGLGISVGTTVAGLVVAILALILHSIAKYRLVQTLTHVEREAQAFVTLIDENNPTHRG